jgi:hypothetical protein
MLAVTSDKSTLHIFDVPHPSKPARSDATSASRRLTSMGNGGLSATGDDTGSLKWGLLGKIPLLPRVFSDIYSFASSPFEIGEENLSVNSQVPDKVSGDLGNFSKGIIGWTSDHSLVVIGAGRDGRWEKFIIAEGEDGKRYCVRDGWKRYLGPS